MNSDPRSRHEHPTERTDGLRELNARGEWAASLGPDEPLSFAQFLRTEPAMRKGTYRRGRRRRS